MEPHLEKVKLYKQKKHTNCEMMILEQMLSILLLPVAMASYFTFQYHWIYIEDFLRKGGTKKK